MKKFAVTVAVALSLFATGVSAQLSRPRSVPPGKAALEQVPALREVGIDQKLDAQIPMDLMFNDEAGQPVRLGSLFAGRPVILALVYHSCPMLCSQVLSGFAGSLQGVTFTVGKEYDVLVVSFDPKDTPTIAADRKHEFTRRFIHEPDAKNIHFLTGDESSIKALTGAVGFRYTFDATIQQFAHPAAITVLTPQGHVSRYLYGVEFAPRDLKLALVEASAGQVGTLADQAMLFCYHYDPDTGKYGLVIMNGVRMAGALTVLTLVGWIVMSLRRERRQARAVQHGAATTGVR